MLRSCLTMLVLLPSISAQTPSTLLRRPPDPVPIVVTGRVAAIDTQVWQGFKEGPGLFMTVQNSSGRSIQGYVFETVFTDTFSGERVGPRRSHSTYKQPKLGVALTAEAQQDVPKPYPLPIAENGTPATYSFSIDLVVFADGSMWGPGKTQAAKELISRIQGGPPKHR